MKRVAIVVQRCHESVVGGSEALAWQYAKLLSTQFEVEVLTSTAMEYTTWDNVLPEGRSEREGIAIHRFHVDITRGAYWEQLHGRMVEEVRALHDGRAMRWREAAQDEFIRFQGPHCPALERWLRDEPDRYAAVVFCTYLYPTTFFPIRAVSAEKVVLVPTLHDEAPAHLPVFAQRYARYPSRIWLTEAERRVAAQTWGFDEGEVIGMAIEGLDVARPERRERPYLLYCGRIDQAKGCDELLRAFARLADRGRVSLVFTGADIIGLPKSPDIEFLGFVDDARKRALMAGALAFVLPSRYESFSIVTLEAMAQRTPVLVNGDCDVMRDHIEQSGGGLAYRGVDDLVAKLERLCALSAPERERIGNAGRDYVLARYAEEAIRQRLVDYVGRVIEAAEH